MSAQLADALGHQFTLIFRNKRHSGRDSGTPHAVEGVRAAEKIVWNLHLP